MKFHTFCTYLKEYPASTSYQTHPKTTIISYHICLHYRAQSIYSSQASESSSSNTFGMPPTKKFRPPSLFRASSNPFPHDAPLAPSFYLGSPSAKKTFSPFGAATYQWRTYCTLLPFQFFIRGHYQYLIRWYIFHPGEKYLFRALSANNTKASASSYLPIPPTGDSSAAHV